MATQFLYGLIGIALHFMIVGLLIINQERISHEGNSHEGLTWWPFIYLNLIVALHAWFTKMLWSI